MKKIFMIAILTLTSASAFSAPRESFYECGGLAESEEYRVGINLQSRKAGFFDNDSTSYMELTGKHIGKGRPSQTVIIFEGKEASFARTLKLYFNITTKNASLYSIDKKGKTTKIGSAQCVNAEPWDDLN